MACLFPGGSASDVALSRHHARVAAAAPRMVELQSSADAASMSVRGKAAGRARSERGQRSINAANDQSRCGHSHRSKGCTRGTARSRKPVWRERIRAPATQPSANAQWLDDAKCDLWSAPADRNPLTPADAPRTTAATGSPARTVAGMSAELLAIEQKKAATQAELAHSRAQAQILAAQLAYGHPRQATAAQQLPRVHSTSTAHGLANMHYDNLDCTYGGGKGLAQTPYTFTGAVDTGRGTQVTGLGVPVSEKFGPSSAAPGLSTRFDQLAATYGATGWVERGAALATVASQATVAAAAERAQHGTTGMVSWYDGRPACKVQHDQSSDEMRFALGGTSIQHGNHSCWWLQPDD